MIWFLIAAVPVAAFFDFVFLIGDALAEHRLTFNSFASLPDDTRQVMLRKIFTYDITGGRQVRFWISFVFAAPVWLICWLIGWLHDRVAGR